MRGFIFGKNPSFVKSTLKFENKIYTVQLHSLKQVEEKNAGLHEWE